MSNLMQDPMFFYGIAFVIFLMLAYRYGKKPLLGFLDAEILKIREELEQARKLRVDAETMLQEYKKKQVEALSNAEAIVKHARDEAARLKSTAEADLKNALKRHEQQALEHIRLIEAEALAEVRSAAVGLAMKLAEKTLETQMDDATAAKLADQAIADLPKRSSQKAEAA